MLPEASNLEQILQSMSANQGKLLFLELKPKVAAVYSITGEHLLHGYGRKNKSDEATSVKFIFAASPSSRVTCQEFRRLRANFIATILVPRTTDHANRADWFGCGICYWPAPNARTRFDP